MFDGLAIGPARSLNEALQPLCKFQIMDIAVRVRVKRIIISPISRIILFLLIPST